MKKIIILVLAFGAGMAFAEFRAGFARVDATPPLGLPLVEPFPAFIIEANAADSATDDLKALARDARAQIDGKKYDVTFRAEGITDIEKIGLAYFKDKVELCKDELTVHK